MSPSTGYSLLGVTLDPRSNRADPKTVNATPSPERSDTVSPKTVTPNTADATRLVEIEIDAATRLALSRSEAEKREADTTLRTTNAKTEECHDDQTRIFREQLAMEPTSPARHASSRPFIRSCDLGHASLARKYTCSRETVQIGPIGGNSMRRALHAKER